MENPIHIEALFKRFLENKCTPEEVTRLLAHFRAGRDEEQLTKLISEQLEKEPANLERHVPAVQEVYNSLASKIEPRRQPFTHRFIASYYRNAAIWLLLLMAVGGALFIFTRKGKESRPLAMRHIEAGAGEKKEIILPDSSHIWLNAGSSVDYPVAFEGAERSVGLSGEAFFDVRPDAARPFVIRTGALRTRVVGTSFNISAYPEDSSIAVSVVTGRVNVASERSKASVDLSPDEQGIYGKFDDKLVSQAYPNARGLAGWKEGKLQFRNRPLHEVIRTLERRYDVSIRFDGRSRECPVHADFDDTEPVGQILKMLAISLNGNLNGSGETGYSLVTEGCF